MLNTADLAVALNTALATAKSEIAAATLNANIPLLGPGLAEQADTILAVIDDLTAAIETALSNLPDPAEPDVIAAEFSLIDGITAVAASGAITLDVSTQAILDLSGLSLATDLGIGGNIDLTPAADLAATLDLALSFDVDAGGVVSRLPTTVPTSGLTLQGNVDVGAVGALGYLGIDIAPPTPPATPDIDLSLALDLGPGGGTSLSISGGAGVAMDLETNMPSDLLPSIGARFVADLAFDGTASLNGAAIDVAATIGFEDITLDPGALVDFFDRTLGGIADVATTFPLGEIVDVLSQRLPVIDSIAPGRFDKDDDGDITTAELITEFLPGADLGFIGAVADLLDVLEVIARLGNLTDDIALGDLTLSAEATAKIGNGESLTGTTLFGGIGGGDILGDLGGFGDAITGALDGDFAEEGSLSIPLIEDPLATLGALLLNGFGADEVTLIEYDLPKLEFSVRPEISFSFGPVAIIIEGKLGAETDFAVGFDTTGLNFAEQNIEEGFYITTDAASGGGYNPFATLSFGMGAGGGLDFLLGRVLVIGGVTGTVDLNLAGSDDGKTRASDLAMFPCIFDSYSGKLVAGLEVEFSIGRSPLKISDRLTIGEVTLANFNGEPCEGGAIGSQIYNAALASETGAGDLRLNVGPAGIFRHPPGEIGQLFDPLTGTFDIDEKENFHVTAAPADADGIIDPDALAVHAYGYYEVFTKAGAFGQIVADGGTKRDRLTIDPGLAVAAVFEGGALDDTLSGGALGDSLSGDSGEDWLIGAGGDDTLIGGDDDDVLTGGQGADILNGGAGFDEADYSTSDAGITLTPVQVGLLWEFHGTGGAAAGDTLQSIEYLRGSEHGDVLFGNPDAQSVLHGNGGDDSLTGGDKNDMLVGGKGADTIDGGLHGNSTVAGDINGDIVSYVLSDSAVFIDLTLGSFEGGDATGDVISNVEVFQLTYYNDSFNGDASNNYVEALFGDDFLAGAGGQDTIIAAEGNDTVFAVGDGDSLHGGGDYFEGANAGYSNPGRDLLTYVLATGGVTVDLGAGTGGLSALPLDVIEFADVYAEDLTLSKSGYSSFEDVNGSNFADSLTGDDQGNVLRGLNGSDTLRGAGGSDTLIGGAGGDDLGGGAGTDWVDYSASNAAVTINLATGAASGGHAAGDTLTSVEAVTGSLYADDLSGNLLANILDVGAWTADGIDSVSGGLGQDTVVANYALNQEDLNVVFLTNGAGAVWENGDTTQLLDWAGIESHTITTGSGDDQVNGDPDGTNRAPLRDVIATGAGNDTVSMGSGNDIIDLGSGDDHAIRNASVAETFLIDGGTGLDALSADLSYETTAITLYSDGPSSSGVGTHLFTSAGGAFTNFELFPELTTGAGRDHLTVLGAGDKDWNTGAGADTVAVNFGENTLLGGESFDLVIGTEVHHQDQLTMDFSTATGISIDSFAGGGGSENLVVRVMLDADGDGVGTVESQRSTIDEFERVHLTGSIGNDSLRGVASDEATAGPGDTLLGESGNDTLSGIGGNDSLVGGSGVDRIFGGLGDDTVWAGVSFLQDGAETVTGGGGADLFVLGSESQQHYGAFNVGADYVTITDFDAASGDTLQLHGSSAEYSASDVGGDTHITTGVFDNLVAVLQGVNGFDLDDASVTYLDDGSVPGIAGGTFALAGLSSGLGLGDPFVIDPVLPAGDVIDALVGGAVAKIDPAASASVLDIQTSGDPRAFGRYYDAPFDIGEGMFGGGIVLSTGDATEIVGANEAANAGGAQPTAAGDVALTFESIGITAGGTEVFRALLPDIVGGLNSITLRDSNNAEGASGAFSGFDLDAVFLSTNEITTITPTSFIGGLDVFDFSPLGTHFTPGIQRVGVSPPEADLRGTFSGIVDEGDVRLGLFDYDGNAANGGAFAMGDGGAVTFDLTQSVDTSTPTYLYVGNAFSAGEALGGSVTASDRSYARSGDLSTDLGLPGGTDEAKLQIAFDFDFGAPGADTEAPVTAELFNLVMVTEELPEAGGTLNPDQFEVKINGLSAALLTDDRQATFQNLATSPFTFHEDLALNLPTGGAFASEMRADAYTTVLRVSGPIRDGLNIFEFSVADGTDALLDTAIFLTPIVQNDVTGTNAAEALDGTANDDTFYGLDGADTLQGFGGRDTYIYGPGDLAGDLIIEAASGPGNDGDAIHLGVNISDAPTFRRAGLSGRDLEITLGPDVLTVQDQYSGSSLTPRVESLYSTFLDKTWDLTGPILFTGLAGDDSGADRMRGSDLGEILNGGTGADNMDGEGGDDIYRVRLSDYGPTTFDSITEATDDGFDTIEIVGPLPTGIRFQRDGVNETNLVIFLDPASSTQGIVVEDHYSDDLPTPRVEQLTIGGTDIDLTGGLAFEGILGSELIVGTLMDDTLLGAGGDTLEGFSGDDVYEVTAASMGGTSVIETAFGGMADRILFTDATLASDIRLQRDGSDDLLLVGSGGTLRIVDHFDGADLTPRVETLEFADGTQVDLTSGLTFTGTSAGDLSFQGSNGDDTISGLGGDDGLIGFAGNDSLNGGTGNDTLRLGLGGDTATGGAGADTFIVSVFETDGNTQATPGGITDFNPAAGDILSLFDQDAIGTARPFVLRGQTAATAAGDALGGEDIGAGSTQFWWTEAGGDVTLFGDTNDNRMLDASDFALVLQGQASVEASFFDGIAQTDPALSGSSANDTLTGSTGGDWITAFDGDDTIAASGGDDSVEAGEGADTVDGGTGDDTIFGGGGNDSLVGGGGIDEISGGDGHDTLDGSSGADAWLSGDAGNDWVEGGGGNDVLYGGRHDDTLLGGSNLDTLDGGDGDDRLFGEIGKDSLIGGAGDDYISGANANDTIEGGAGDDTLLGQGEADLMTGGDGNDSMTGGESADSLFGEAGNDTLDGGAYNDSLDGGSDADTLLGNSGLDTLLGGTGNDSLNGGSGNDTLMGEDGEDTLDGHIGKDSLEGGAGADSLIGGAANDTLDGGAGADTLDGGSGSDLLIVAAGEGGDLLTGGAGLDTFDFETGFGTATITDFSSQDTIDLVDVAAVTTFADLTITYSSAALVDLGGGDTITLLGVTSGLDAGDFAF